jgi:apolipoprotein N-acyltransferase
LKSWVVKLFLSSRYLLGIAAGLLLAVALPGIGVAGFAWIAPGLMVLAALGTRGRQTWRVGYVAGLAYYLASLSWLLCIPYRWHSIPIGPITGWLALCAYLALYPACWVWLATKISGVRGWVPGESDPRTIWLQGVRQLAGQNWSRRVFWALACAAIWVALEMIVTRLLGGFPWNLLGASQERVVPLIQVASFTGVYGVSFLVVWCSVSLLCAGSVILRRPHLTSAWMGEVLLPLTAVIALFVFGFHRMAQSPAGSRELRVTLIQPSIPQTLIWDPAKSDERFQGLIRLSESALGD